MSEEDRSRIYAWLCDEMDEQRAEYLMSCLSPAPLAELATKADMLVLKADMLALKDDFGALKDDFNVLRMQRDADRAESRSHFRWLAGIVCGFGTAVIGFGIAILVAVLQAGAVG